MPAMPRTVSTRIFPFLLAILATAPAIALELPSEETHAEVPAAPHSLVAQTFMSAVPPTFLSAGHSNGERASGLESPRYGRLESLRYRDAWDGCGSQGFSRGSSQENIGSV